MLPAMYATAIRDRKSISMSTQVATSSVIRQGTCVPPSCKMAVGTMPLLVCVTAMGNLENTVLTMMRMKTAFTAVLNSAHSPSKVFDTMATESRPSATTGKPILPLFWKTLPVHTGHTKALPPSKANATGRTVTTPVRTARITYLPAFR